MNYFREQYPYQVITAIPDSESCKQFYFFLRKRICIYDESCHLFMHSPVMYLKTFSPEIFEPEVFCCPAKLDSIDSPKSGCRQKRLIKTIAVV